jgi:hypothetical protein
LEILLPKIYILLFSSWRATQAPTYMDTSNTEEEDENGEKSVLYDLWVLSPEWTDSTEPVNIFSCVLCAKFNELISFKGTCS